MLSDNYVYKMKGGKIVKKVIILAGLLLGLCVITSGLVQPQMAAAYKADDVDERVHEYIAEAGTWFGNVDPEIRANLSPIVEGASHEDVFDHIYDRTDACVTITHFWDPDNGDDTKNGKVWTAFCEEWNAWVKARQLWGMALGEYYTGDFGTAYEYLGHVAHLLSDLTVPAHAHQDSHVYPDEFDDNYMDYDRAQLSGDELAGLLALGPVVIPEGKPELYYLFYTTAQVGDFYASDDVAGDSDDPQQWCGDIFATLNSSSDCREAGNPEDADDCDLNIIRTNSYFYAIRAVASLYELFEKTVKEQSELTVLIESVAQIQGHGPTDDPDYFFNVGINEAWFMNEGSQEEVDGDHPYDPIHPGWAVARNAGLTGNASVKIQLWDDDDDGGDDCPSDIFTEADPDAEERAIFLTVTLDTGAISGDLTGTCGVQLYSEGDDEDRSKIWFRIILPNIPPTADAGPDQTANEGDQVTLTGTFTDPNTDDSWTYEWHMVSSTNGQVVSDSTGPADPNTPQSLIFVPCDNGTYTFSFTVTDSHGASDTEEVVVTVMNVSPVVTAPSISHQPNVEFILPVVHDVSFEGMFTDAGSCDTHTAVWDWGDGTTSDGEVTETDGSGCVTSSHTYALPGDYSITVTVTDDDGQSGSNTMTIHIADVGEALDIFNDYIQSLPATVFKIKAKQCKNAFDNMFTALDDMLSDQEYQGMIQSLNSNLRTKFDGLVGGNPKDDWIIQDLAIQAELCQKVDDITSYLQYLLSNMP